MLPFVQKGENAVAKGIPYTLISLIFGWWGFAWGPICTVVKTLAAAKMSPLGVPAASSSEYGGSGNAIL